MGIFKNVVLMSLVTVQVAAAVERPVVAGPDIEDGELRSFVERADRRSLSEFLDANRPGTQFEERLRAKLEKAQRAWLNGSSEVAKEAFIDVTELGALADWRDSEREALLYSHLRLAQLSGTSLERAEWLAKGARLVTDLEPDSGLFPPPIVAEFKDVRSKIATQSTAIVFKDVFPGFRYVLIDGRKISLESATPTRISPGLHRITAWSDRHSPITEHMSSAQLGVFRIKVNPIVESCGAPTRTLEGGLEVDVYDGPGCASTVPTLSLTKAPDLNWAATPNEVKARPRRDWLWIGAGVVASAVVFSVIRNQKKSDPTPSHRDGF